MKNFAIFYMLLRRAAAKNTRARSAEDTVEKLEDLKDVVDAIIMEIATDD